MTAAPAGWSRSQWTWDYRERPGGPVTAFYHLARIAEVDWPDLQAEAAARTGRPLPDAAKPSDADRLAALFRHEEGPR